MKSHNLFILLAMIVAAPHLSRDWAGYLSSILLVGAVVFWRVEK